MPANENTDDDFFADLYEEQQPAVVPSNITSTPVNANSQDASHTGDHQSSLGEQADIGAPNPDKTVENPVQVLPEVDEEPEDDDVDFNLGNTTAYVPSIGPAIDNDEQPSPAQVVPPTTVQAHSPPPQTAPKMSSKDDGLVIVLLIRDPCRKMFIGGLNWETTDQSLRQYFSQFGEVIECTVMRDNISGRSRGFGFLTFKDPRTVNVVMVKEHFLDGKIIDPKRAIPRDEQEKTSKIFVGGVSQDTTDQEFKDYFAQFGRVVDATLMMDKDTGRPRGFGFVTFESDAGVEACLTASLAIHGKPIEVKKAQPRGMRDDDEASRRPGKFGKGKFSSAHGANSSTAGPDSMPAFHDGQGNGMSPQAVAQMYQRVQQMMAMQQMMMGRGGATPLGVGMNSRVNSALWSQMLMQQMMMGRGGGAGMNSNVAAMGNMNPNMINQMQLAFQQQGLGQGTAAGGSPNVGPHVPFNAYEQQMFEHQKYEQRRQTQHQAPGSYTGESNDVAGGNGTFGMGWEASPEECGQQQQGQQRAPGWKPNSRPQTTGAGTNAPPANAPTGPKNAGRPGANFYRGGARGGRFHPYHR